MNSLLNRWLVFCLFLFPVFLGAQSPAPVKYRYVPHLSVNPAWQSKMTLANPSSRTLQLRLDVRDPEGRSATVDYALDGGVERGRLSTIFIELGPGRVRELTFPEISPDYDSLAMVVSERNGADLRKLDFGVSFLRRGSRPGFVSVPIPEEIRAGYRFANFTTPEKLTLEKQLTGFAAFNPHAQDLHLRIRLFGGQVDYDDQGRPVPLKTADLVLGPRQKSVRIMDGSGGWLNAGSLIKEGVGFFEFEARDDSGKPLPFAFLPLGFTDRVVASLYAVAYDPDRRDGLWGGAYQKPETSRIVIPHASVNAHNPSENQFDAWKANLLIHNPSDRTVDYQMSFYNAEGEAQLVWLVDNPYKSNNFRPSVKAGSVRRSLRPGETRYALLYEAFKHEDPSDPDSRLVVDRDVKHVSVYLETETGEPNPLEVSARYSSYHLSNRISERFLGATVSSGAINVDEMRSLYTVTAPLHGPDQAGESRQVGVAFLNPNDEPIKLRITLYDHLNRALAQVRDYGPVPVGNVNQKRTDFPRGAHTLSEGDGSNSVSSLDGGPLPWLFRGLGGGGSAGDTSQRSSDDGSFFAFAAPAGSAIGKGIGPREKKLTTLDESFFGLETGAFARLLPMGYGRVEFEATAFGSVEPKGLAIVALGIQSQPRSAPLTHAVDLSPFGQAPPLDSDFYQGGAIFDWNPFTLIGAGEIFSTGMAHLRDGRWQGWGYFNDLLAYPKSPDPPYDLYSMAPKDSAVGFNLKTVRGSAYHVCAIWDSPDSDVDEVICWGSNHFYGLVGFERRDGLWEATIEQAIPVDLGGRQPLQLAVNTTDNCVITETRTETGMLREVWCWGQNSGKWYDGRRENKIFSQNSGGRAYKVDFEGDPGVPVQIVGNDNAFCALFEDGRVQCWGDSVSGHLGASFGFINDQEPQYIRQGTDRYRHIALGPRNMCAVLAFDEPGHPLDGSLKCWGSHTRGALGSGTDDTRFWRPEDRPPIDLGGKKTLMAAISNDSVCALLEDGTVHCWGSMESDALGAGEWIRTFGYPLAHQVEVPFAAPVRLDLRALYIEAGYKSYCVVQEDLSVKCWGDNQRGLQGWECLVLGSGVDCRGVPDFMRDASEPNGEIIHSTHFIGGEYVMDHLEPLPFGDQVKPPTAGFRAEEQP